MYPNPTLPPQQSLALAIALEDEQICSLHRWALRLRPFDSVMARLFGDLRKEAEAHKGELLYHASRYLDWNKRLRSPVELVDADEGDHFFIVRAETAQSILDAALAMKEQARRFYRYCSILEPRGSLLGGLYKNLGAFQDIHTQLLQDARGRLESQWCCTPATRSAVIPDAGPFAKGLASRPSPEKNPGLSI